MKRRPSVKSLLIRRNADIYKTLYLITIHKIQFPSRGDVEEGTSNFFIIYFDYYI